MGDLLTKLVSTIENLLILPLIWICPIKWSVVIPGSSAIRFTFGKPSNDLKPGVHFATIGQTIQKLHVQTKLAIAESMYVLTEDGLSIRIRGVAIYRVISLAKFLTATEDSEVFCEEACEAAIRSAVSRVPFDDLVTDSETVEDAIKLGITEICKELGIRIKRYRFQDIEITDPIGRGLSSIKSMSSRLSASAKLISQELSISPSEALVALSPNIQFVADILRKREEEITQQEEINES